MNKAKKSFNQDNYQEALKCYDKIISEIDANYAKAGYGKGMVFIKLGKINDATNCINRALELDPEYRDAKKAKEHITLLIKSIPYIDESQFE
jgi:Flp pilus assembly protein TadD, contains TPR repeats